MSNRPLNVGLVGGGKGAFIVHPHQKAIHFDGTRRVTAGALFPDPKIALEEAANWPYPNKGYGSYDEMIAAQAGTPANEKLDYLLIVTPSFVHFDPAMKALDAGIPVFCEKPLTVTLEEAEKIVKKVREKEIPFGVAHTYLGHWTTRFSRYIVRAGLLGDVRWVDSYYLQGWLATKLEDTGMEQATWRVDPKKAGRFTAYLHLNNGARALVRASQISIGHLNDLGIEVNGTQGTLRWRQEDPEVVTISLIRHPDRVHYRGAVTPGDGLLPQDVPVDLMTEPPSRPAIPKRSTTPLSGSIASSRPISASSRPENRSSAAARNTITQTRVERHGLYKERFRL